ncbi:MULTISPECIES: RNA polymerase sigma factor [Anoxybacillus]|uniref:RNA polymerase ECF(Extracytoplasmic function)-type sigma factor (Sigma-V) n=1 Tax=Anoxybacillus flavithermus TaxID=33934 RepID=A0A178TGQ6_9BACL|nr:sigma factor-like helix-turn-helix DNA-binding protein [Anoxybacillus flavithermus]ASA97152.1 hypothetical protein CA592_10220 [Anoxybacillus flavithermus]ELK20633.1 RNA polymerase sigma-70 factor [Anoxybacillus flavithermus TNO-09.006]MBE2905178.1 RNA polymerase subunit sigma-70 [Anoxybacillus flavithermus]MBE2908460.1 RNA polymerase subunit sigma-70 [Anoxybacillus flavithermus]MBE2910927.1 RNA polymerase subunit sigma-70 [Anoxybacillus flavithermus]
MTGERNEQHIIDFIMQNQERCYRLAYSYVQNEQDALDVVHDSIVKALRYSKTLKDIGSLKTWFYKIVVHTSLDYLKKRKKMYVSDCKVEKWYLVDYSTSLCVTEAISMLSPIEQTIIKLRFFEDMRIEDISEILDMNKSTVKTKLYAALRKMKGKVSESYETDK